MSTTDPEITETWERETERRREITVSIISNSSGSVDTLSYLGDSGGRHLCYDKLALQFILLKCTVVMPEEAIEKKMDIKLHHIYISSQLMINPKIMKVELYK